MMPLVEFYVEADAVGQFYLPVVPRKGEIVNIWGKEIYSREVVSVAWFMPEYIGDGSVRPDSVWRVRILLKENR